MKHLFGSLLLFLPTLIYAQAEPLRPDQLDYYLQQALNAGSTQQRHALNHIGIQVIEETQGYRIAAVLEDYPAQRRASTVAT